MTCGGLHEHGQGAGFAAALVERGNGLNLIASAREPA